MIKKSRSGLKLFYFMPFMSLESHKKVFLLPKWWFIAIHFINSFDWILFLCSNLISLFATVTLIWTYDDSIIKKAYLLLLKKKNWTVTARVGIFRGLLLSAWQITFPNFDHMWQLYQPLPAGLDLLNVQSPSSLNGQQCNITLHCLSEPWEAKTMFQRLSVGEDDKAAAFCH